MAPSGERRLISADDHIDIHSMPKDLWQKRLPKRFRERGPRVVETDDGPFWQTEGRLFSPYGRKEAGLLAAENFGFRPSQPEERIKDLDADGVYAQVIYAPSTVALQFQDGELKLACLEAYNDWAVEFNRYDRNRLIALPDIASNDPEAAAAELTRCIAAGHRGASVSGTAGAIAKGIAPIFAQSWQRFWDIASEAKLPIHVHLAGGLHTLQYVPGSWSFPAMASIVPMQLDEILAGMVFSGILEQRPEMPFILAETGLGWLPYALERMDYELHKYGDKILDHRIEMLPSEIFRRQVLVTYQDERFGVECIPRIGVENVMWASDYPHGDTTWPESHKAIDESPLATLGAEAFRKVTYENAARIYGIE
ncbi:MAG: amidohydrolase family protein [Deltaproteobacteria bacterium]|nr:amidohydrolase family protein [Deltaproteobacteria bacterium]MBW2360994.1 amidohydrolase family protein [Deltaproteobacteria bacterium]